MAEVSGSAVRAASGAETPVHASRLRTRQRSLNHSLRPRTPEHVSLEGNKPFTGP